MDQALDRQGTTKKLCDKDFAEHAGELSGAVCLKTLVLMGNDPVTPSNRSENSLVLFVRCFGSVSPLLGVRKGGQNVSCDFLGGGGKVP